MILFSFLSSGTLHAHRGIWSPKESDRSMACMVYLKFGLTTACAIAFEFVWLTMYVSCVRRCVLPVVGER